MGEKMKFGCGQSRKSTLEEKVLKVEELNTEEELNMIKVGKPAPLFTAPAFYNGEMTEIKLEDFKGQWVLLCFYPGDFTFV